MLPNPLIDRNNAYADGYRDGVQAAIRCLQKHCKGISAAILIHDLADPCTRTDPPELQNTACTSTEPRKRGRANTKPPTNLKTRQNAGNGKAIPQAVPDSVKPKGKKK